jgi:hypothetical protein
MDEREFIQQINQAWGVIKDRLKIDRTLIRKTSLKVDIEFNEIALNPNSSYEDIYRIGLSRSHYNVLLRDYSYFQFSFDNEDSWRLAYYPNPRISGVPAALELLAELERHENDGLMSHEEVSELIAEMPSVSAVPPIRYEYAKEQYEELAHPASHFHVGRDPQNRWPCAIMIGPLAFVMFVSKMYYPNAWETCSVYYGSSAEDCIDQKLIAVIAECNSVEDFSENERRSFHLGKNMAGIATPVAAAQRRERRR